MVVGAGDNWLASIEHDLYLGFVPDCVWRDGSLCSDCQFGDPGDCPLLQSSEARSYLRYRLEVVRQYQRKRRRRILSLRHILEKIGVPLHWEIVAKVAMDDFPHLFESPNEIRPLLFSNEDTFTHLGDGVFEASKRRRKGR